MDFDKANFCSYLECIGFYFGRSTKARSMRLKGGRGNEFKSES